MGIKDRGKNQEFTENLGTPGNIW